MTEPSKKLSSIEKRSIVAPDLITAARYFISVHDSSLQMPHFAVSIDHSPSEQSGHDSHTMALVISQNMEHQIIADEIAKELNLKNLRQWKNANNKYKKNFHLTFFNILKKYPVLVVVFHAKELDILKYEAHFVNDIGAFGAYKKVVVGEKEIVEVGPFIQGGSKEPEILKMSAKHAPMAAFTASCLLRVYDSLRQALYEVSDRTNNNIPLRIEVWSDRPPTNFDGPYGKVMGIFLWGSRGKFTYGGFTHDDNQQIDLLADNLAGMCNEFCSWKKKYEYRGPPLIPPIIGTFLMETFF
jgi:hypothetical protein